MDLEDTGPEGCSIRPDWEEIYWHRVLSHNSVFNILLRTFGAGAIIFLRWFLFGRRILILGKKVTTTRQHIKKQRQDFPGTVVKNSTCQCRGHGFSPWCGKTPHAAGQLSL